MSQAVVSMLIPRAVVATLEPSVAEAVLAAAGLSRAELDDADALVPKEQEERLWRAALDATGDERLGIRAALALPKGAFGGLEYAVRTSGTVVEGLQRLARFGRLLHGEPIFGFEPGSDGGALHYLSPHLDDPRLAAVIGDFALAASVRIGRDATGAPLPVAEARLARPRPVDETDYLELFGPTLVYDAGAWQLRFRADALTTRMQDADSELCAVLERYLERDLAAHDVGEPLLARIRAHLRERLGRGDEPSVASLAEALGMGERTLQRRLGELETSYSDQLDVVRRDLAQRLLRRPDVSVTGVALLLGYGEVSSFYRAFRRWTGTTPGRFRRS